MQFQQRDTLPIVGIQVVVGLQAGEPEPKVKPKIVIEGNDPNILPQWAAVAKMKDKISEARVYIWTVKPVFTMPNTK